MLLSSRSEVMKSLPSHYHQMITHSGRFAFEVYLWILIYGSSTILTSWDKQVIDDNFELMRESDELPYITSVRIIVTQAHPFGELFSKLSKHVSESSFDA